MLDPNRYGELLAQCLPGVIETEEDNERMLAEIRKLMLKGEDLAPEEEQILRLMSVLVEAFEEENYPIKAAVPHEVLRELMEANDLRQKDLYGIFGSSGLTSEVVNGKRSISKAQAKAIAERFHVSPEVFLYGNAGPA